MLRARGRVLDATGSWFARDVNTAAGPWRTGLATLRPMWRLRGAWPSEAGAEIALGEELARALGVAPGDEVTLAVGERRAPLAVTGIVRAGGLDERRAWVPLALAQRLADRAGELDRVALSALVRPAPRRAPPDPVRDPVAFERWSCTAYPANVARDLAAAVPGAEVVPLTEMVAGEAGVVAGSTS